MGHRVLDRFELAAALPATGASRRWLAVNREPNADESVLVIVTGFPPSVATNDRLTHFVGYEASLAQQLRDPMVARLFAHGVEDDRLWIAAAMPTGVALSEIIAAAGARREFVPVSYAVHVLCGACAALNRAHNHPTPEGISLHIVHGAVAPHRIHVRHDGGIVVSDFVVGRLNGMLNGLTRGQAAPADLPYSSPEQIQQKTLGPSTDVFQLGAVFWEALAGKPLYEAEDRRDIDIVTTMADAPSSHNAAVTTTLDRVILRALEKAPASRHPDLASFETDLRAFGSAMPLPEPIADWLTELLGNERASAWKDLAEAIDGRAARSALVAARAALGFQ